MTLSLYTHNTCSLLHRRILRLHPPNLHFPPQQLLSPPDKALALYIQSPGSPFLFCSAVMLSLPSVVLSLPWPEPCGGSVPQLTTPDAPPLSAKISVSVEDLAALPSLDVAAERKIERLAMKVGENLFYIMQSICGVDGSKLWIFCTGGLRSSRRGRSAIRSI